MVTKSLNMYLHVASNDCLDYFPDNNAKLFRVKLAEHLNLQMQWECALVDVIVPASYLDKNVYFCSNICAESMVGGIKMPLLRAVYEGHVNGEILQPFYTPVVLLNTEMIEFSFRNRDGTLLTSTDDTCLCTLHLRPRRF